MAGVTPHILLIEDDADASAALVQILTDRGHSVRAVANGQDALNLLERGLRPLLIIIDLMLPSVSGWDVLTYLQTDPELRHTATMVITGVPKQQLRVVTDAVFQKPLDFDLFATKVDSLVARAGV